MMSRGLQVSDDEALLFILILTVLCLIMTVTVMIRLMPCWPSCMRMGYPSLLRIAKCVPNRSHRELESFLSISRVIAAVPYFMYVQTVAVNARGEDNDLDKKHQC
jgi:hypothetical protein